MTACTTGAGQCVILIVVFAVGHFDVVVTPVPGKLRAVRVVAVTVTIAVGVG